MAQSESSEDLTASPCGQGTHSQVRTGEKNFFFFKLKVFIV